MDIIAAGKLAHGIKNDLASSLPRFNPAWTEKQKILSNRQEENRIANEAAIANGPFVDLPGGAQKVYILLALGTPCGNIEEVNEDQLLQEAKALQRREEQTLRRTAKRQCGSSQCLPYQLQ